MSDPMVFTVLLSVLLVLLAMGMWVALSLTIMAFVALVFFANPPAGQVLATTLWGHSHSWPLAALPLFIRPPVRFWLPRSGGIAIAGRWPPCRFSS